MKQNFTSRNTSFTLQSNPPAMCACTDVTGQRIALLDDMSRQKLSHVKKNKIMLDDHVVFFRRPVRWKSCCATTLVSFKLMRGLNFFKFWYKTKDMRCKRLTKHWSPLKVKTPVKCTVKTGICVQQIASKKISKNNVMAVMLKR